MKIKDLLTGTIHEYGTNPHDSLAICADGKTLSYFNLQNGDGSRYGDYRFVLDDGEIPEKSNTPEAFNACCYFNIGGFNHWHDLIHNSFDLPEENKSVIIFVKWNDCSTYAEATWNGAYWLQYRHSIKIARTGVVAWKYMDEFEGE